MEVVERTLRTGDLPGELQCSEHAGLTVCSFIFLGSALLKTHITYTVSCFAYFVWYFFPISVSPQFQARPNDICCLLLQVGQAIWAVRHRHVWEVITGTSPPETLQSLAIMNPSPPCLVLFESHRELHVLIFFFLNWSYSVCRLGTFLILVLHHKTEAYWKRKMSFLLSWPHPLNCDPPERQLLSSAPTCYLWAKEWQPWARARSDECQDSGCSLSARPDVNRETAWSSPAWWAEFTGLVGLVRQFRVPASMSLPLHTTAAASTVGLLTLPFSKAPPQQCNVIWPR